VALCNEATLVKKNGAWGHSGDSMDVALLALALKMGISPEAERAATAILGEIPFESERRYAATACQSGEARRVVVKGAVEAVAPFCGSMQTSAGEQPLDTGRILRQAAEMAENGYRVLAIAEGPLAENAAVDPLDPLYLRDLTHLGLIGFMDPLRPQAKDAVAEARRAGVKVVMITGDHPATAFAIARELGIADSADQVLTGAEVDVCNLYDTPEFHERLKAVRVFARVAPAQKLCIVDHLMEVGEFVAVTGDGVNDAPALNRANIGVAMGSGTEVAKDAAQIIITDDDFSSIVSGIEEGRYAYANVRKVTLFLIATGFAQLVLIGAAVLLDMPVPFLAAQLLWMNLVTNGIQDVGLAFEAGERGLMDLPPRRPTEGIFNRLMIEQVLTAGLTMALVCLGAWWYLLENGTPLPEARNELLALLIMMQFYHVLNSRSEYRSAFRIPLRNNRVLFVGMAVAFAVHIAATHVPAMQSLLGLSPLPVGQWMILGIVAATVIVVIEISKLLRRAARAGG
jgi:magnesium-transporting ATPase (P-type)